jgi:hypothetical protein
VKAPVKPVKAAKVAPVKKPVAPESSDDEDEEESSDEEMVPVKSVPLKPPRASAPLLLCFSSLPVCELLSILRLAVSGLLCCLFFSK